MNIGFLVSHARTPYDGVVRPFLRLAKHVARTSCADSVIIVWECAPNLIRHLGDAGFQLIEAKSMTDLARALREARVDLLVTDDSLRRLRLLAELGRRTRIATCVYVQILFGVHAICDVFSTRYLPAWEKTLFRAVRAIPFNWVKRPYVRLLSTADIVVANSVFTATWLQVLYGVESQAIIHPPVDESTFATKGIAKREQALVYVGARAGDTDELLTYKAVEVIAKQRDMDVVLLGNTVLAEKARRVGGTKVIRHLQGVSDEELALQYSESRLTVCTQRWETFGYVPVESVLCGTPAVTFSCLGVNSSLAGGPVSMDLFGECDSTHFLARVESELGKTDRSISVESRSRLAELVSAHKATEELLRVIGQRRSGGDHSEQDGT